MKKLHSYALYALVTPAITFGAGSVMGQQPTDQEAKQSTSKMAQSEQSKHQAGMSHMQKRGYLDSAPANALHASNLIGAEVKTTGDEKVGPVNDLIIDKDGQVVAIVVGVGGFLGMGQRDVAIAWDGVTRSGAADKPKLAIDVTREGLRSAPEFDAEQSTSSSAQSDQSKQQAKQSQTQTRGYLDSVPANGLQASSLMDAKVTTTGDEKVGPVSDLIIDKDGQVVAMVVGVGGFLGMGERDVAIAWDDVARSGASDELELAIDVTREGLRSAPEFGAKHSASRSSQSDQSARRTAQSDSQSAADRKEMHEQSHKQSHKQNRGYLASAPANGLHASNLIGAKVTTTGDEKVGPVSDLIIDKDGQVVAIVVGVGGFLGMGERNVAIGWDDVARSGTSDEPELRIDVTAEALRAAPKFETQD